MIFNEELSNDLSLRENIKQSDFTKWTEKINHHQHHNDNNENNDRNDSNDSHQIPSRPSIDSLLSSVESEAEEPLPFTPLTPKFVSIKLPSELFQDQNINTDTLSKSWEEPSEQQRLKAVSQTPQEVIVTEKLTRKDQIYIQETPKNQIPRNRVDKNSDIHSHSIEQLKTPPNSRLRKQGRQPLIEPQAIILRPTTFWRHHPLSPHSFPSHSPSSRLIRRSALIASPTIGIQHPNPDQETTRICVGLAGVDLDTKPRTRRVSLLPI
ncbi:uncharacterized protein I206_101507 [Kwoniella pini CBS 10737]|uniref:Uncharacterized protein n=1 Tax=Kwoniella pini CBS 10737 TaxID=1296096 RepID=A0A1B9HWG5_9TREE|nr:uncharacterized protein I206_06520 [Kwoniella pini CBS 10737]OCF47617.1 hypothetical protein I206_06520 [Kwoniella pini CBS 10737]